MNVTKQQLRSVLRAQRQALTAEYRQQAADQLLQHFIKHALFNQQHFAFYVATNGEMNTEPLLTYCCNVGKQCYLPILSQQDNRQLYFGAFQSGDKLQSNRYGIKEPIYNRDNIITAENLDVVFLPLVAFDNRGNRLGMGAGYYDTTFAFLRSPSLSVKQPLLIGVAYSFQEVVELPKDAWDIPLHGVITELGIQLF